VAVIDAEFADFVRANERALLRLGWLLMADRHAAEDLVQTALEKTLPKWQSIRHDDPMAYVHRVMLNTRTSWWRRHKGRESLTSDVTDRGVGDQTETFAEHDRLTTALQSLTPGQRKVVVLRHYGDLSEAQVAALLGCSVGTVKSQNARALARLRLALAELAQDAHDPHGTHQWRDLPDPNDTHGTQTALATGMEGA
jgi:RNA polymerase sigma-70 factor (sigma-E family)